MFDGFTLWLLRATLFFCRFYPSGYLYVFTPVRFIATGAVFLIFAVATFATIALLIAVRESSWSRLVKYAAGAVVLTLVGIVPVVGAPIVFFFGDNAATKREDSVISSGFELWADKRYGVCVNTADKEDTATRLLNLREQKKVEVFAGCDGSDVRVKPVDNSGLLMLVDQENRELSTPPTTPGH